MFKTVQSAVSVRITPQRYAAHFLNLFITIITSYLNILDAKSVR